MRPRGGGLPPVRPSAPGLFTIWALHDKVVVRGERVWLPIVEHLPGPAAVAELTVRQDRLRRRDEPCRLVMLEDGKAPWSSS